MVKIMLDIIFSMSNDAIVKLQLDLNEFGKNGLAKEAGKNVSVVLHWLLAGSVLLE